MKQNKTKETDRNTEVFQKDDCRNLKSMVYREEKNNKDPAFVCVCVCVCVSVCVYVCGYVDFSSMRSKAWLCA